MKDHCQGKNAYDKKGAQTSINYMKKRKGMKLRMYQCPESDHWHLTSRDGYGEKMR